MSAPLFHERLSCPWWAHPVVISVAILVALESSFLAGGLAAQGVVVLVFAVGGELLVWRYGSRIVEVSDGYVRAGRFRLRVAQVRAVATLGAEETRRELRSGDENVYRCTRSWVSGSVMLDVDDPGEAPLWLVSTRHPDRLAAALADAALLETQDHDDHAPLTAHGDGS